MAWGTGLGFGHKAESKVRPPSKPARLPAHLLSRNTLPIPPPSLPHFSSSAPAAFNSSTSALTEERRRYEGAWDCAPSLGTSVLSTFFLCTISLVLFCWPVGIAVLVMICTNDLAKASTMCGKCKRGDLLCPLWHGASPSLNFVP